MRVYIQYDAFLDSGSLSGGWSLTLATPAVDSDYVSTSGTLTFTAASTSQNVNVTGDGMVESDETFFVNLSNAVNATILDAQGVGTILNDDTSGGGGAAEGGPMTR